MGGGVAGLGQAARGIVAVGGFFHGAGVAQGALGQQTAQGIALEAGDLAGPGVDDVGQFTGGVVDVALPAAVEADFVGELVTLVVAEVGVGVVLVVQGDETAGLVA